MLKIGYYDLWSMRMKQYFTHIDYALWKVIINGDSPTSEPPTVGTVVPLKTEAQKLARKNELKAKSTLLLAIPDEHLLKFHSIKDAKSLWEAIKIRFGGNKSQRRCTKTKRRHFNQRSASKTNTFLRKINSAAGKNVTTAGPKAVVNATEGKKENVVKSSTC
nr:ribonuclease H-like domain-containing protein [Tanacetum cinerariifolium]